MKTEQEQIEKMARIMCGYCSTDGKCAVSKNGREPDICANVDTQYCLYKEYAERLFENGCYGDVSEYKNRFEVADKVLTETREKLTKAEHDRDRYKAEIEQLKAKNKVLGDGVAKAYTNGFTDGRKQVEKDIRRAKINAMIELKEKIVEHMGEREYMGVKYKQGVFSESEIDEFIQDVEDDKERVY